jgi:ornithine carbamoyltransferase
MRSAAPSPTAGKLLPPGAALDHLLPEQAELVLANARLLQRAMRPFQRQGLLRGRNLALICESAEDADALVFLEAASDLGAHVSHIRPSLSDLQAPAVLQHTARVLGRLYEGIECQGLPADLVGRLRREAGIPVYDGVSRPEHPVARLAKLLPGGESFEKGPRLIVQAVLMSTVG